MLQLQTNMHQNLSRFLARTQPSLLKRYHISKVFRKNIRNQGAPLESTEAVFDLVSMNRGQGDEVIYEAEAIKVVE